MREIAKKIVPESEMQRDLEGERRKESGRSMRMTKEAEKWRLEVRKSGIWRERERMPKT